MSVQASKYIWRVLALSIAIVFAYATVLVKLGNQLWVDENYSHGLLIPFIIAFILWARREQLAAEPARPSVLIGGAVVLFALFALWAGTAGAELYTQRISLVLLLAGTVIYFWGFRLLRLLLVPAGLLLLAIPIPAIVFNKIAFPLQLFASRCAVWSMSLLDIPVLRQGNVIELLPLGATETRKLEVVEACSGIRSLMTLVTLAVVFAYFTHPNQNHPEGSKRGPLGWLKSYGLWRSTIIVLAALPIAILTNALRVSGTGVLAHYYGPEIADGFFHSFSGWVIYVVAFLMLFGVGWILDRFRPSHGDGLKAATTGDEKVNRENRTAAVEDSSPAVVPVVPAEGTE